MPRTSEYAHAELRYDGPIPQPIVRRHRAGCDEIALEIEACRKAIRHLKFNLANFSHLTAGCRRDLRRGIARWQARQAELEAEREAADA